MERTMLDPKHFQILAGHDVVAAMRAPREALRERMKDPKYAVKRYHQTGDWDHDLCELQKRESRAGYRGAELVATIHGWSVRHASGLQGFGILHRSTSHGTLHDGEDSESYADAIAFAERWVAQAPARRYAYKRNSR
jgi:hypothetical protein